jgi:hypothetical protein
MKESTKTISCIAVAAAVLLIAWATQPAPLASTTKADFGIGEEFFPSFKDPLLAKTLEIKSYDEETATIKPFEVTQNKDGIWSIPSHSGYPADASRQLAEAAASLMDIRKLELASEDRSEFELYGVVDPDSKELTAGSVGVGVRVVLKNVDGAVLTQFIIGKADKDRPGVRFVRIPGQDAIFRAEIATDKLSTNFQDWIEPDLLKLNALDVKQISINDHSIDELNGELKLRSEISVGYDSKDSKWMLETLKTSTPRGWANTTLKPDEELNTEKLNDLKTALDDLKILDVSRKPAGLSGDLRVADKLSSDQAARMSLREHGFYLAKVDGKIELYSNEGDVHCSMTDGVEYILRFGEIAGRSKNEEDKNAKVDAEKKKNAGEGVSRYIMVTTRFNDRMIPKPAFEPLPKPKLVEEGKTADGKSPEEKKPEDKKPDEKPADKKDEKQAGPAKPGEKKVEVDPEVARIEKENKQKQDEYDDKLKEGQKRVKELNARFADWYYVISEATYDKIHLTRDDVIKKKEAPKADAAGTGEPGKDVGPIDQFDLLKNRGLPK